MYLDKLLLLLVVYQSFLALTRMHQTPVVKMDEMLADFALLGLWMSQSDIDVSLVNAAAMSVYAFIGVYWVG